MFRIDPLTDARWPAFVQSHPRSSIFHTVQWLEALWKTYRYTPIAFTTCAEDVPLRNGIVFCQVDSWLTGSKWVSLPFSDHCQPLVDNESDSETLLSGIRDETAGKLKFAEIRPLSLTPTVTLGWRTDKEYYLHLMDLHPTLQELHARLHKNSQRAMIRRADRESVVVEQGRSDLFVSEFYRLLLLTRRRHGVPPQPMRWFRNLIECLGDRLTIYIARVDQRSIASILTLRHKATVIYKYGCSDERYHNLGGMARLFWQMIQDAKSEGLHQLDLGRSDQDNEGLIRFKEHLGASRRTIQYWQFSARPAPSSTGMSRTLKSPAIQAVLSHLPTPLFRLAGEMLYRHAG